MAIYIYERIDIVGGGRGKFIELIREHWARYAEIRYGVRLAGVWATVGSTAAWPEANLLWEMDDWGHFAKASAAQYPLEDKDPLLAEMWRQALAWRSGGRSSLLVPAAFSPTLAQIKARGTTGEAVIYEEVTSLPGKLDAYHAALKSDYLPLAEQRGVQLIGAYRHAVRPNLGMNFWMLRDWSHYAQTMDWLASDESVKRALARCRESLEVCEGWMLSTPPAQRLRT